MVVPRALLPGLVAAPAAALQLGLGDFEALLAAEVAAVLEHVAGVGVERPEAALARLVRRPRHFDETVVEGQRVS